MKTKFNLLKVGLAVIMLAGLTLFNGCQSNDNGKNVRTINAVIALNKKGELSDEDTARLLKMLVLGKGASEASETPETTKRTVSGKKKAAPAVKHVKKNAELNNREARILAGFDNYVPAARVRGRSRSVGSDTMDVLMAAWNKEFKKYHNELICFHQGKGSSTATPALCENHSDFGPMSRELKVKEITKFKNKFGYKQTAFPVAVDALAVYVHPDNPIVKRGMTLQELDAVFSSTRNRLYPKAITTWGQLGLGGVWKNAPIRMYGRNSASGTYSFFKKSVTKKGKYSSAVIPKVGSAEIIKSVAADKYAIGYSGIGYKNSSVAVLPLSVSAGKKKFPPEERYAYNKSYPLARYLYLTLNLNPKRKASPLQSEFIKYIYSGNGQLQVREAGFFPVSQAMAVEAKQKVQ